MKFSVALFALGVVTLVTGHEAYEEEARYDSYDMEDARYNDVGIQEHNSYDTEEARYDSHDIEGLKARYHDSYDMEQARYDSYDMEQARYDSYDMEQARYHKGFETQDHLGRAKPSYVRGEVTSHNQEGRWSWPWESSDDTPPTKAPTKPPPRGEVQLKILCINAHIFKGSAIDNIGGIVESNVYLDEERLAEILKLVEKEKFDMVGFTEVWSDANRDKVSAAMSAIGHKSPFVPYPTLSVWEKIAGALLASPGLVYADKGHTHTTNFNHYEDMVGTDQLAYKGVAYGISEFKGHEVGWILTHAQASYEPPEEKWKDARTEQIKETLFPAIDTLIYTIGDGPIVLLGDLNIEGDTTEEYTIFKYTMESKGFVDCWLESKDTSDQDGYTYDGSRNSLVKHFDKEQDGKGKRFDYIWVRAGNSGAKCSSFKVLSDWKVTAGGKTVNVSDHDPVEVVLTIPAE